MPTSRVISYERAFAEARRMFHAEGALDMEELARRLSVSRATLYRVVGSRDRLLGDVLWQSGEATTRRAVADAVGTGVDRLLDIAARFNAQIVSYGPLRSLLHRDPSTAFRVLFMAEGGVHVRFVDLWRRLFVEAQEAGEFDPPVDPGDLAFVFVRIGESILYADLLASREPDLALAATVQRSLLTAR